MVRTKAGSVSTKAVGAKAPQKVAITAMLSGNAAKGKSHSGGNSYHPRETPGWQKPITFFMKGGESSKDVSKEAEESEKTLETDMEVDVIEKVEVKKKKIQVEKTDKPTEIKKHKKKNELAKISKDSKEKEKQDQGIAEISTTDSSKKKILNTQNDMEVEETVDAEIVKEKVKNSKEIEKEWQSNKDEGENKENTANKVDNKKKKDPEVQQDEGEDNENQFKKEDRTKKQEAPDTTKYEGENKEKQFKKDDNNKRRESDDKKDIIKSENNIHDKVVPKTEQSESQVLENAKPGKKEDPKEEENKGKQDDQI